MKLMSICLFAVLFLFQAVLGLHLGDAGVRGSFGQSRGHGPPGGPGGPGGPPGGHPPPPPPPANTTSSG